ncbi:EI24 domain-containing protein [Microcoleus sp. FACHB-831]|uniref:EI24 domain-containing protein n=1 Tax=Microcoleus sp. FACHB-831 TaxID=2692827 RepID=UPI002814C6E3|nr:EI24 domain-containing protein [Microcoleus sp. FACHB-831]
MIRFFRGLFAGATYHLRALAILNDTPELRGYVLIPILVNVIIGVALYVGLLLGGVHIVDILIAKLSLPNWASAAGVALPVLEWLLRILLGVLLLIVTAFLQVQFGVVLGAPWYGMLSEQLEKIRIGQLPPVVAESPVAILGDIGRSLFYELKKLLLVISFGVPLFIIGFVPPIGPLIASIGGILVSSTIICLDFFDAPLERRRLNFRTKLAIVRQNLPASSTFGLVSLFLVTIPLINLLSIPLCVSAGTLFVCDRVLPTLPQGSQENVNG